MSEWIEELDGVHALVIDPQGPVNELVEFEDRPVPDWKELGPTYMEPQRRIQPGEAVFALTARGGLLRYFTDLNRARRIQLKWEADGLETQLHIGRARNNGIYFLELGDPKW